MPNVLICEDNNRQRVPMAAILDRAGYRPIFAASLAAARDHLASTDDLVALVTDVHLPDGNGLELLTDPKRVAADLPTIVITGDYTEELVAQAKQKGALAVFPKPLDYDQLIASLP